MYDPLLPGAVVVVVDGSEEGSFRTFLSGADLAQRRDARLVIVLVASIGSFSRLSPDAMLAASERLEALETRMQTHLQAMEGSVRRFELVHCQRGNALNRVVRAATESQAEVVVVGTRQRVGRCIPGRFALRIINMKRWVVTVVP